MLSVIKTKFSAFREDHPVVYRIPYQLFMLTMFYVIFYGIWHEEALLDSLHGFLKNTGIFLSQISYALDLLFLSPNLFAASWIILFVKQTTTQDFNFSTLSLILLSGLVQMSGLVISAVPGMGTFAQFVFNLGFILLGFTIALFSRMFWNMAKKDHRIEKLAFYAISIGFPVMYLLVLVQKIF